MKILFVRTYCPNPIAYGSEMRGDRFVEYFRQKGTVDLLTLTPPSELADMEYIYSKFDHFYYFDQKKCYQRISLIEKIFNFLPWQIMDVYDKDCQQRLNKIIEEKQYDLIFVFKLEPVLYFLRLPAHWQKKVVIDFDDILSELYRNYYKNFFVAIKNSCSLGFYECKALAKFKRIFVCSQNAVSKIPKCYQRKVGIIPNVFQPNADHFFASPGPSQRLLFIGSLDYFPNTEGLQWFCNNIWSDFLQKYPDVTLTVVGKTRKDASVIHQMLGSPRNVEVITNVPSVLPHYENCAATIVPLLNGSGTRLKILESAAYGRPVITTLKGMEGLDFQHQKDIFIFKNASTFTDAYKTLLNNERYLEITRSALSVLNERYSPEVFLTNMHENWKEMIKACQPAGGEGANNGKSS